MVIASDGVFEFLTNQMVADIITTTSDPIDACRAGT
jgi:cGMP-dependent protein kinase